MKKCIFVIYLIVLSSLGCSIKNYDYKIELTNDEYKILKGYGNRYKYIHNDITLHKDYFEKKNYVFSNNKELLVKIKNRTAGIDRIKYNHGPYTPIIINYMDKYYDVYFVDRYDWLNDEELYDKLSSTKYIDEINLDISDELTNLSKDEFIEKYFEPIENNKFHSKLIIESTLFVEKDIEKELLFETLSFLGITKYNLFVSIRGGRVIIEEIIIE